MCSAHNTLAAWCFREEVVMRIILHADDFGLDEQSTTATIECLEAGSLTSASVMANMPATGQAVDYARRNDHISFGVHLVYVTDHHERPVANPVDIPTLIGHGTHFHSTRDLIARILQGRVSVADIERETAAQIGRLIGMGLRITHVDSHGHIHKYGVFRRALAAVLPKFGISRVRIAQDTYTAVRPLSPTYWLGPMWRSRIRRRWASTEHFFMPTAGRVESSWPAALVARIKPNRETSLEIGVHPGYDGWRNFERIAISAFVANARPQGHKFISWHDI
jgi:predicted glycoside hydrolase/deacetylase ChbG (UPF0249 family)